MYGGARGGGKSEAGRAWLLYPFEEASPASLRGYRALVIRLNAKDLSSWLDKARPMYEQLGAQFVGNPVEIRFPNGAVFRTGHLKDESAYTQYQGAEYQRMLIEELTQIPDEKFYEQLISSCRSSFVDLEPQIFCTANPGGLGHEWVKKRWGIQGIPEKAIITKTTAGNRVFIHATVYDNPKLMASDPTYVPGLENLSDPNLKKAWLYGDWENPEVPGQIYKDELDQALAQGRITKVPHDPRLPVHTYWDIGVGDSTCIWFMQYTGSAWRAIDYYESSGKGLSHYRYILDARGYFYGQHFGPHDLAQRQMADKENAQSIAAIAEDLGLLFTILPRQKVQHRIEVTKMKFPLVYFDETKCKQGIQALRAYRREYDDDLKKFKDTPVHDWSSHAADAFGYWAEAPDPLLPGYQTQDFGLYAHDYK